MGRGAAHQRDPSGKRALKTTDGDIVPTRYTQNGDGPVSEKK